MKKLVASLSFTVMLSACGASIDDLVAYTQTVKANTPVSIEEYPEFTALPNVNYSSHGSRSPFLRSSREQTATVVNRGLDCAQPNQSRRKGLLERYGLDGLAMTGVFTNNGSKYALIKANDGSLHKVSQGSYIGLFYGRVTQINNTEILIKEMLPDGAGCWKSKQAKLTMSSMVGENNNV